MSAACFKSANRDRCAAAKQDLNSIARPSSVSGNMRRSYRTLVSNGGCRVTSIDTRPTIATVIRSLPLTMGYHSLRTTLIGVFASGGAIVRHKLRVGLVGFERLRTRRESGLGPTLIDLAAVCLALDAQASAGQVYQGGPSPDSRRVRRRSKPTSPTRNLCRTIAPPLANTPISVVRRL